MQVIKKELMSKEERLLYIIKHGKPPKLQLITVYMSHGPNKFADTKYYVRYVLTDTNNPNGKVKE